MTKIMLGILLALTMAFVLMPVIPLTVGATDSITPLANISPKSTMIEKAQHFRVQSYYANAVWDYLYKNTDGSVASFKVSIDEEKVYVATCASDGTQLWAKEIDFELPIFGVFFSGEKYNFIAFGKECMDKESDDKEVIRIVKYDKEFNRLGSLALDTDIDSYGITTPFSNSSGRMAENGNILIFHTARQMYRNERDGFYHQANFTCAVNIDTMESLRDVGKSKYVSHSFDQYIMFDGDKPIFLDHGDGYPLRSVMLYDSEKVMPIDTNMDVSVYVEYDWTKEIIEILKIEGAKGENFTGVSVGGLAMSDKNYLVVMDTIEQDKFLDYNKGYISNQPRDIVVCVVSKKGNTKETTVTQIPIYKYAGTDKYPAPSRLLSNGDNTFTVLWQEAWTTEHGAISRGDYIVQKIDGGGNPIGEPRRFASDNDFYREFLGVTALPGEPPVELVANPTASTVLVNGKEVAFDAYLINSNNYFKLRDLAYILSGTEKQFDVGYDSVTSTISLTSGKAYTTVGGEMESKGTGTKTPTFTTSKITLDSREVKFTAYLIDGNNYFKLRDIGETFGFGVEWNGTRNTIVIDTGKGYTSE